MSVTNLNRAKPTVIAERFPYRYVECGTLEINGMPDYRIQKMCSFSSRYKDMYLCDNQMQFMTAIEDLNTLNGWTQMESPVTLKMRFPDDE